jgi:hypothetical protein
VELVERRGTRPPPPTIPINLLAKVQIILDKVVVWIKERERKRSSAAPPENHYQLSTISHSHSAMKKNYQPSTISF